MKSILLAIFFLTNALAIGESSQAPANAVFNGFLSCKYPKMNKIEESALCAKKYFAAEVSYSKIKMFSETLYLVPKISTLSACPTQEQELVKSYEDSKYDSYYCFSLNRKKTAAKTGIVFFKLENGKTKISKIKL